MKYRCIWLSVSLHGWTPLSGGREQATRAVVLGARLSERAALAAGRYYNGPTWPSSEKVRVTMDEYRAVIDVWNERGAVTVADLPERFHADRKYTLPKRREF